MCRLSLVQRANLVASSKLTKLPMVFLTDDFDVVGGLPWVRPEPAPAPPPPRSDASPLARSPASPRLLPGLQTVPYESVTYGQVLANDTALKQVCAAHDPELGAALLCLVAGGGHMHGHCASSADTTALDASAPLPALTCAAVCQGRARHRPVQEHPCGLDPYLRHRRFGEWQAGLNRGLAAGGKQAKVSAFPPR